MVQNILNEYVNGLIDIFGNHLKKVILYGSYARGEEDVDGEISDIDVMILVDCMQDDIKEIEKKVLDYTYELDLEYNILLSPIIENIDVYNERSKYMAFYKNVKNKGVLING